MTYEEFKKEIIKKISKELLDVEEIKVSTVSKNNGVKLDGLVIREKNINISPTIYLNNYYSMLVSGTSIDKIISEILYVYNYNKKESNFDISFFEDFDKVKNKIIFKLVNAKKNQELLEDVPHVKYLDLAIIFYYLMDDLIDENNQGLILIHKQIVDSWNVTVKDLMKYAMENTPKHCGLEVKKITEVLKEMTGKDLFFSDDTNDMSAMPLLVVTNEKKNYGAATLIYKDTLSNLAGEMKSDLFIIPSSIHEAIVFPATDMDFEHIDDLKNIICQINSTELDEQDILSDNLYYYSREEHALSICS